ncbi:ABC transporter permease [Cellulomonas sp. GbtcB1]|uniref:ABC transporter permease n=1 Tax=Cellulomonas sp. GbtcB1 TaxID=2824746 RepID=UPI001C305EE3|nr:ABC transporter permease [Cellulomonas sp. GbtcB1]
MTTSDATPAAVPAVRLDFSGLLRSEVIKARGLRSTRWLLVFATVLPVVIAVLTALTADITGATHDDLTAEALTAVTATNWVPLLLVLMLGTIVATAEYERGAVQTTFAVAPRRASVVLAKAALVAGVVLASALVSSVLSYQAAALLLGGDEPATLGDPDVLRVLLGTALYMAAAGTIATCVGFLVRSSIGAVATTLGFLYVVPALLQAVPIETVDWFARTIPGPASGPLELPGHPDGDLTFTEALLAVVAWTGATLTLTCAVVRRRDV